MKIRKVSLEILRPGPPHNHLLSPLTQYIALCGDEPPETFQVPFEHYRLLRRLQGLGPPNSSAAIDATLGELREDVVRLLCGIRCLATSLAEANGDGAEVIELELVLSASELSLIPFEIAFHPGSPTRELAHREVIVIRRSRRVPRGRLKWNHRPRILLVAASPPGYPPVPIEAHVGAFREVLAPWLAYLEGQSDQRRILAELKKFLTVLPNASELSIQEAIHSAAIEKRMFTHVHVLAHGGEVADDDGDVPYGSFREPRFGLVLHSASHMQKRDTLSGRRIFSALAGSGADCERQLPQVVTIASCDSGNQGGVLVPGASVAHEIHDGGVPLVVAAQFPLTYGGSTLLVKRLYERLLEGDDPRCALRETRRSVHAATSRRTRSVDWAAIVQYGALPHDLDKQVYDAHFRAVRQRLDAAVSSVDPLVTPDAKGNLATAWDNARTAISQLEIHKDDPEVDRYLARVYLRWAFVLRNPTDQAKLSPESPPWPTAAHSLRMFRDGLLRYYRITHKSTSLVEALVGDFLVGDDLDYLMVLTAAMGCSESLRTNLSQDARRKLERALIDLWVLAPAVTIPEGAQGIDTLVTSAVPLPPASVWFEKIFDRQFGETPPTDFEYYAARRWMARIAAIAEERDQPEVLKRAREVESFLAKRGVLVQFSAVVDWFAMPDGGQRTVGT